MPLAVAVLASCTSTVNGQPNPESSSSGPTTSASSNTGDPFAGLSTCVLVDQAVAGQGFPPSQPDPVIDPSRRQCGTKKPGFGNIGMELQAGQPYNTNLPANGTRTEGDISGRPSVQLQNTVSGEGGCDVVMEVKPNSRVIVLATLSTGTTAQACDFVGQVATKIERLLPKNN
ncbi:DUF3558 family protein [Amycolatopsis sp.]|uniref:DUF3558 family protein n=1 Tax=Amycolatopsis sp. TaxID=37632 RepID=UPI00261FA965|nr:DUF3558 family protein [Amycolatopsis sp.]